jgi:hypothetical protein
VSLPRTYPGPIGNTPVKADSNVTYCGFEYQDAAGIYYIQALQSVDGGSNCPDLEWYDMTWAFVLYDYTSTAESPNNGVAPLIFKTIFGVDVQPTTGSLLQAIAHGAPVYDPLSLRIGATTRQLMPDSLPSSANDFGSIFSTILKFAPDVLSIIKGLFSKAPAKEDKSKAVANKAYTKQNKSTRRKIRVDHRIARANYRVDGPLEGVMGRPNNGASRIMPTSIPPPTVNRSMGNNMTPLPRRNNRKVLNGTERQRQRDNDRAKWTV